MFVLLTRNLLTNCKLSDNHWISPTLCLFLFPTSWSHLTLSLSLSLSLPSPPPPLLRSGFLGPLPLLAVSYRVSLSLCEPVCLSYLCECCVFSSSVFACPLSRSPRWRGGRVAQVQPIGQHLKLLKVLLDPSSSLTFYNLHLSVILSSELYTLWFFCWYILYTHHLFPFCPSWERDHPSVALPDGFFHFFPPKFFGGSFSLWVEV